MKQYDLVKLSDFCEITSSKRIYAKEYTNSGIPFYRGKEVVASFSGGSINDPLFIPEDRFESIKYRFGAPEKGDLLLTSVGTIGVPYRVSGDFDFYFKDGNLTWFRNLNGVDANFLYYWLQSPQGKAQLSKCTIGAAQPAYTIERLKEIHIKLPPEVAQKEIASVIATYDNLIENNRRRIQLLEESARLLYQEWFVHMRFPGHEQVKITDGVPEGWNKTTADRIMDVLSGGTPKTKVPEFWGGEIPFFTPKDAKGLFTYNTEKSITELGLSKCNSRLYPKYTVFITARGTVGKLSFAQRSMAMNQSCYALIAKEGISQEFLYSSLKASIEQFKARASGAVFDAIVVDTFKNISCLIPSSSLIDEFTAQAKDVFSQIDNLSIQNQKLTQARDLLLPKLMSGELTVSIKE
ncbi:MAG: type I restriction endonuclease subunit S [Proteobacteria bacterium]|nr:MAG: type I restriction endonuclease subunit S [Pseudomonadota bacterium]